MVKCPLVFSFPHEEIVLFGERCRILRIRYIKYSQLQHASRTVRAPPWFWLDTAKSEISHLASMEAWSNFRHESEFYQYIRTLVHALQGEGLDATFGWCKKLLCCAFDMKLHQMHGRENILFCAPKETLSYVWRRRNTGVPPLFWAKKYTNESFWIHYSLRKDGTPLFSRFFFQSLQVSEFIILRFFMKVFIVIPHPLAHSMYVFTQGCFVWLLFFRILDASLARDLDLKQKYRSICHALVFDWKVLLKLTTETFLRLSFLQFGALIHSVFVFSRRWQFMILLFSLYFSWKETFVVGTRTRCGDIAYLPCRVFDTIVRVPAVAISW